jgi:hypothetical protein
MNRTLSWDITSCSQLKSNGISGNKPSQIPALKQVTSGKYKKRVTGFFYSKLDLPERSTKPSSQRVSEE